ncbi:MAG: peptidoglycan DD-metalloendopeptidase family protein [Anaerolineales bacterium]|nr:peptidoglycan DD-metalloendopeptidase family protein [Anaerolineales bacterium]
MWPNFFELDPGESYELETASGLQVIELLSVEEEKEPDFWNPSKSGGATFARALCQVRVNDVQATLTHQPFQTPLAVNGVRLYVETTKNWAAQAELDSLDSLKKTVRFSALPEEEPWGPENLVFPIAQYRWRACTFNNTWSALVPYDLVYYHRGEDYAAVPDKLDVLAVLEGEVVTSPFDPQDEFKSNSLAILHPSGYLLLYGHMNIGSINPKLQKGYHVRAGEKIGQVGCTWLGEETGHPHLHISLHRPVYPGSYDYKSLDKYSPFPMLAPAYFRAYPDSVLPIAGGYRFTIPGKEIELDGSRSLARPGRKIVSYAWIRHDRSIVNGPKVKLIYDRPGLYSEGLFVETDDGSQDLDFAYVRVYDPSQVRNVGYGDLYYFPNRNIPAGQPVLFWIRMVDIQENSTLDFGDGSPPQQVDPVSECTHIYNEPGLFIVSLNAVGASNEPIVLKTRIIIGD